MLNASLYDAVGTDRLDLTSVLGVVAWEACYLEWATLLREAYIPSLSIRRYGSFGSNKRFGRCCVRGVPISMLERLFAEDRKRIASGHFHGWGIICCIRKEKTHVQSLYSFWPFTFLNICLLSFIRINPVAKCIRTIEWTFIELINYFFVRIFTLLPFYLISCFSDDID